MDDFVTSTLTNTRCARRTYLVTYSQADLVKFPDRKSFGDAVCMAFNKGTVNVLHWACSLEPHKTAGQHYHVSLKLSGPKRWKSVKENISNTHGIVVNFSDKHDNYYSAYKYVCKSDSEVYHSEEHPDLKDVAPPRTTVSTKAYRLSRKRTESAASTDATADNGDKSGPSKHSASKIKRLSNLDVSEYIVSNNIHTEIELLAAAKIRKEEGQKDLANFVLSRSPKALKDLLENSWKMHNSCSTLQREKLCRMELIEKFSKENCVPDCNRTWIECAIEVLNQNEIHPFLFAAAVRDLLKKGRGKFRNIFIHGPANTAKSFMLKPLEGIFKVFSNPANDKYAWVGADEAELILLQDFRWSSDLITWKDLLLLLEGENVNLPSPKNHFVKDVCISSDIPIFATGKAPIQFVGRYNVSDERENEMMTVRWNHFHFHHQITEQNQKHVPPCNRCFAELTLFGHFQTSQT